MNCGEGTPSLSLRLKKIAEYASGCTCLCDIGTDHAYLPVYMIKKELCQRAYAADIGTAPLSRAEKFINENGLESIIKTFLSDGLKSVPNDYDTVVIAGMGGEMIMKILSEMPPSDNDIFVLQPMTNADYLRGFLYKNGFEITDEDIVREYDSRYYFIIKAKKSTVKSFSFTDTLMSQPLRAKKYKDKSDYISHEICKYKKILDNILRLSPDNKEKEHIELMIKEYENIENI